MTEDEAQVVAQKFLHFLDYWIGASAVNALEVAILDQGHRRALRTRSVVTSVNGVLESNDLSGIHNNPSALRVIQPMHRSSRTDQCTKRLDAKSDRRNNAKSDEKRQRKKLREQEWKLGLRGSNRLQDGHLLEGLHDQNEDIEIECHHSTKNVNPTPGAGEVKGVARNDRNRQHHQRDDADPMGRRKLMERKEEPIMTCTIVNVVRLIMMRIPPEPVVLPFPIADIFSVPRPGCSSLYDLSVTPTLIAAP